MPGFAIHTNSLFSSHLNELANVWIVSQLSFLSFPLTVASLTAP